MMEFIILGAGHGKPVLENHLSSIYVNNGGYHFLFDCGEGTSRQMLRHNLNHNLIDAVVISHYHPDHIAGIFMLLQMYYLEGRTKPLLLFVPERPADLLDAIHLFYTFEHRFSFSLKVHTIAELEMYFPEITPIENDHLTGYREFVHASNYPNMLLAYSFLIENSEKSLLYTSDLETTKDLKDALGKCSTAIVDAMHPKYEYIVEVQQYPIERIILTHGLSPELSEWLSKNPNHRFEFAKESSIYNL